MMVSREEDALADRGRTRDRPRTRGCATSPRRRQREQRAEIFTGSRIGTGTQHLVNNAGTNLRRHARLRDAEGARCSSSTCSAHSSCRASPPLLSRTRPPASSTSARVGTDPRAHRLAHGASKAALTSSPATSLRMGRGEDRVIGGAWYIRTRRTSPMLPTRLRRSAERTPRAGRERRKSPPRSRSWHAGGKNSRECIAVDGGSGVRV